MQKKILSFLCGIATGIFVLVALRGFWLSETVSVSFHHANSTRFTMILSPLDSKGYKLLNGSVTAEIPETANGNYNEYSILIPVEKLEHLQLQIVDCAGQFALRDVVVSGNSRQIDNGYILTCGSTIDMVQTESTWKFNVSGAEDSVLSVTLPHKVKGSASINWFTFLNIAISAAAAGYLATCRFAVKNNDPVTGRNAVNMLFLAACFVFLALPPTGIDTDTVSKGENRKLAAPPELLKNRTLNKNFFHEFDLWYCDRFMGRSGGIELYQRLFRPAGKAFPGSNGWYFSNIYGANEAACNKDLYTDAELTEISARLETLDKYLASRNCRFYLVLVPSKGRVYREYYPQSYPLLNRLSKYEQLTAYLAEKTEIAFIDPLPELLRRKETAGCGDLYHRYGTHWTPEGAYVAYRLLRQAVTGDFPESGNALLPEELNKDRVFPAETELLMQLDIAPGEICSPEDLFYPAWKPHDELISQQVTSELRMHNFTSRSARAYEPANAAGIQKPRIYFYGDSFLDVLLLCESAHFSEAVFATIAHAGDYHLRLGAREFDRLQPQIYVLLTNELGLDRLLRLDLPEGN